MFLVRCDISVPVGTGHFIRMTNLANFIGAEKFVFLVKTDQENQDIFYDYNVNFVKRSNENIKFKQMLKRYKIKLIILDLLNYKKFYVKNLRSLTKTRIITFHEHLDFSKFSDLSINFNFHLVKYLSSNKRVFGPKYMIFKHDIKSYLTQKTQNYIFVFFGGSDPSGFTKDFIEKVVKKLSNYMFIIKKGKFSILPSNNYDLDNLIFSDEATDILTLISHSKLSVLSAGNVMYESIFLKKKPLIIAHNKHQHSFSCAGKIYGYIDYFGMHPDIDYKLLINKIKSGLSIVYQNRLIDNNGNKRIKKKIMNLLKK